MVVNYWKPIDITAMIVEPPAAVAVRVNVGSHLCPALFRS
jgi:hypothetical protein